MNITNIQLTPIFILVIQGLLAWALWSIRKAFVHVEHFADYLEQNSCQFQEVNSKAASLENRLSNLEERITLLPDAKTLGDLAKGVESLRGDLKAIDMRITGVDRLMQRLERALDRQEVILRGAQLSAQ